ncbi:hypothetical protein L873DRAFT_1714411 [Choiromyces venosus 120613-1]|uniref:MARVEL domain-containing protein n=1 Tax=Choiromyces venosus 120613-1 TaxID=1336337 RepID=A0A3N4IZT7_9PEZI|nr:hypothetical protein L873DRAFT_1714411 [Choiromyces venosus 120613-1]
MGCFSKSENHWTKRNTMRVLVVLLLCAFVMIGVATVETIRTMNTLAITAITLGLITLVHTVVDITLFFNSKLKPVYVVAMSSIMFSFWLILSAWEIVEMAFLGYDEDNHTWPNGPHKCSIGDIQRYPGKSHDWSCPLPKARFSFSWILVLLYIASIVYSSKALKKEKRDTFQLQVDQAVAAMQAIRPPIMGCPQCGAHMLVHRTYADLPSPQYAQNNPAADGEKVDVDPARGYIFP